MNVCICSAFKCFFTVSSNWTHEEHNCCKPPKSAPKATPSLSKQEQTMLSTCRATFKDLVRLLVFQSKKRPVQKQKKNNVEKRTQKIEQMKTSRPMPLKSNASLLIKDKVVAKGMTLSGDVLYGHTIPQEFTKVMIEEVFDPQAKLRVES